MDEAVSVAVSQETSKETIAPSLLPLDSPERIVAFRSKGKNYRHIFRRITAADWENFFSNIVAEFTQEKGGTTRTVGSEHAAVALYGRAIKRVEGYHTKDGSEPEKLPNWAERIPQDHRLIAADILMKVFESEGADESLLDADGVTVTLDAVWNQTEHGTVNHYRGLVHKFSCPTAEHRRKLFKANSRAFVAGGSRNGMTLIPSSHNVVMKLYDELIESVAGYSVSGRELGAKDEIIREMDSLHKSAAVRLLFPTARGAEDVSENPTSEE